MRLEMLLIEFRLHYFTCSVFAVSFSISAADVTDTATTLVDYRRNSANYIYQCLCARQT